MDRSGQQRRLQPDVRRQRRLRGRNATSATASRARPAAGHRLRGDGVKEEAKYELAGRNGQADPGPIAKRPKSKDLSPGAGVMTIGMLAPIEAIEIHAGYDIMAFLNTVSLNQPIDFN